MVSWTPAFTLNSRDCGVCRRAKQVGKGSYSSLSGLGVGSPRQGRMVTLSLSLVCGGLSWGGKAPNEAAWDL